MVQYFDVDQSDGAVSLVKRLVTAGADLNASDNQGWTPIYQAAYGRNFGTGSLMCGGCVCVWVCMRVCAHMHLCVLICVCVCTHMHESASIDA